MIMCYFETSDEASDLYPHLNMTLANLPCEDISNSDHRWLEYATELARNSTHYLTKVGAVIVQKNKIVSIGVNTSKTHPFQAKHNKASCRLHAEVKAILTAMRWHNFDPSKCTIYVSRLNRKGDVCCSYPCKWCWGVIDNIKIKRIVCYNFNSEAISIKPNYVD